MNVLITGRIGVFTKAGRYQFYAEHMEPDGVGALYIQLEQLKSQLEKEGLLRKRIKKCFLLSRPKSLSLRPKLVRLFVIY